MRKRPSSNGYTLIEMLIVLAIVALLATISFPVFGKFRDMAGFATCISNMRIMHVGFNTYMQDHEMVWPQLPEDGYDEEEREWEWWYNAVKDYGVSKTNWVCPSDDSHRGVPNDDSGKEIFTSSYAPTMFEDSPSVAFRWNQPWVLERGAYHKKTQGPNMLMPDGTIMQGPSLMPR